MSDVRTNNLVNNRYILREKLAEGGMGVVFRATDRLMGNDIALKQVKLNPSMASDHTTAVDTTEEKNALAQEFRAVASIRHPNIISVLDFGFLDDGSPFFTMDYLEDFKDFFSGGIIEAPARKVELLIELLNTLEYLHRRGLLHRDIKPGNVALYNDEIKVLDFGLSIDNETLQLEDESELHVVGTLAYMAPEVLQGDKPTASSDLYAVGVMAYELFTGKHPYGSKDVSNLIFEIISGEPDFTLLDTVDLGVIQSIDDDAPTAPMGAPTVIAKTQPVYDYDFDDNFDRFDSIVDTNPLTSVIRRLLTKSAEVRYSNAIDVVHDLNMVLERSDTDESATVRESYLQSARFVGRDEEIGVLQDAMQEARNGHGSAWLIGGETGVGKTRLVDEIRIHALIEGFVTVRGHAISENDIPYQLWRDPVRRMIIYTGVSDIDARILKDLVTDIDRLLDREVEDPEPLDGEQYRERMQASILSLFNDVQFPLLLLLEDIHWAPNSIDTLNRLATIIQEQPILLIATYRKDNATPFADQLPDFKQMELKRLNRADIVKLSESIIGYANNRDDFIKLLYRETAGNVYFIIEILRELAEQSGGLHAIDPSNLKSEVSTAGVLDILQRRLQQIPEDSLHLLKLMALVGREIDLKILVQLDEAVDKDNWLVLCSNASMLDTTEEGQWRFVHDAMRRTVLNAIDDAEVKPLHSDLAHAIETVYGLKREHASVLAWHWQKAEHYEKELIYTHIAADYALDIGNLQEARTLYERTLELMNLSASDRVLAIDRAQIEIQLGKTLQYLGEYEEALELFAKTIETLRASHQPEILAEALIEQAEVLKRQGNLDVADELVQEALAMLTEVRHKQSRVYAMDRLSDIRYAQGDYASAADYGAQGLALATELDDQIAMGSLLNNLGMIAFAQGDVESAKENFNKAKEIYTASGQRRAVATLEMNLGSVAGQSGDLDTCLINFQNALKVFEAIGEKRLIGMTYNNLGFVASLKGDLLQSIDYNEKSLKIARSLGNTVDICAALLPLGDALLQRGDPEAAKENFLESLALSHASAVVPMILESLSHLIQIYDDDEIVPVIIGHILNNPASNHETRERGEMALADLRDNDTRLAIDRLLEQGQAIALDDLVQQIGDMG